MRRLSSFEGPAYRVFGLKLRSVISLPELARADGGEADDVVLTLGDVKREPDEGPQNVRIEAGLGGRYRVRNGNQIVADLAESRSEAEARLVILGSVLAVLSCQRGLLPLHAATVKIDGAAFTFMGPSGVGKSTLVAGLLAQGHQILGDDLCVIGFVAGMGPVVWPGVPRIKLWADSVDVLGLEGGRLRPLADGAAKLNLPIPPGLGQDAIPLQRLCVLDPDLRASDSPHVLHGAAAFAAVQSNAYHWDGLSAYGFAQSLFGLCAELARSTHVLAVSFDAIQRKRQSPQEIIHLVSTHKAS